jgi:tRNA G18 (ribose-2'-O)-methylase SpoU
VEALIKCALAFHFTPVLIDKSTPGDAEGVECHETIMVQGEQHTYTVIRFTKFSVCALWMRQLGVPLIGIEITDAALSVRDSIRQRWPKVAFVPGNEGSGIGSAVGRLCDGFVYIPQYGDGTASLNVHVATAVVLHRHAEIS